MLQITRYGRDGTIYPEAYWNRSPLRHGTTDPSSQEYRSLSDWYAGGRTGIIELRLPWGLLNVTDPSSRRVVHETMPMRGEVGTTETEGFRIYAAMRDPRDGALLHALPALADATHIASKPEPLYRWRGWEEPSFHLRLKRSYFILRERLAAIPRVMQP